MNPTLHPEPRPPSIFSARRLIAALAVAAWLAGVCPTTAFGQTYTWTGATDTNFNDPANYSAGLTFPTSGTLQLTSGVAIPNAPTLTASATAASLILGQTNAFSFDSTDAAAVLRLTGTTPLSKSNNVSGTIGANIALGGSATQTFSLSGTTVFSGTISGGNAGDIFSIRSPNSTVLSSTFTHAGNTFASAVRLGGGVNGNGTPVIGTTVVASLGTAGQSSSLGTGDTIVLRNSNYLFLSATAAAQSSDKGLVLEWINGTNTTSGVLFGLNGGAVGFNQGFAPLYGTRPALNMSGPITAAPIVGWSGAEPLTFRFFTGTNGTLSGLISESAPSSRLEVNSNGATLTNPNNSFTGSFVIRSGTTYGIAALGMAGSPSTIGASGTITLTNMSRLQYTGAGETSDKTFTFLLQSAVNTVAFIDASGTGELILSNTTPLGGSSSGSFRLGGTGRGTLASYVTSTSAAGIHKIEAGTWTLTGSNAVTRAFSEGGTLLFANRVSLLGGGTADWVKAKVLTASGSGAVMAYRVGGANEFTTADVTTLITNLSGDVSTGGMRSTSSWGFDTTNAGGTFTVADVIANTSGGSGATAGGAIGVVKLGTGTLALTGTNTFTRGVRIEGGVLTIDNTSALGSGTGYLQFAGGTLDLATLSLGRNGGMTATAGGLTNGVISGTGGLTKTGTGTFRIDATANTFTGSTSIQGGVVEVATLANSGVASSLGAPTTNATIGLGGASTSGTLRYVGSGAGATGRQFSLGIGGGALDGSGVGALTVTGTVAGGTGVKTFTLSGTSTAANTIGLISGTGVSVVKDGTGLWRMNPASKGFGGTLTVKQGVLQMANPAAVNDDTIAVGDTAASSSGVAAFLLEQGVSRAAASGIDVLASAGSQAVYLGGANTSGSSTFNGEIRMSRDVTLVAATGGTVNFSSTLAGATTGSLATRNVTIGAAGYAGRALLNNTLATSGSVAVQYGTAVLGFGTVVSSAGTLAVGSGATLGGVGFVTGAIGGAGLVSPGNSPGILTAGSLDPSGSTDFVFEITGSTPNFGDREASVNDVLRLTDLTAPFASALGRRERGQRALQPLGHHAGRAGHVQGRVLYRLEHELLQQYLERLLCLLGDGHLRLRRRPAAVRGRPRRGAGDLFAAGGV